MRSFSLWLEDIQDIKTTPPVASAEPNSWTVFSHRDKNVLKKIETLQQMWVALRKNYASLSSLSAEHLLNVDPSVSGSASAAQLMKSWRHYMKKARSGMKKARSGLVTAIDGIGQLQALIRPDDSRNPDRPDESQ